MRTGLQKDAITNGESLLYLAEEKEVIGIFAVNDPVRKDAPDIIRKLHQSGIRNCVMITGMTRGLPRMPRRLRESTITSPAPCPRTSSTI